MDKNRKKARARAKRHVRLRQRLSGSVERPRLCIFRSNRHIYAQVIDDTLGRTLVSASSQSPELTATIKNGANVSASTMVGDLVGQRCLEKGITKVVFDRAGYRYHGRVKALAEAARKRFTEAGAQGF